MAALLFVLMEVIRYVVMVTRPFSDYVLTFLYRLRYGDTKPLPPIDNKLLLIPAVELAKMIRKKQVSCESVMLAYVDRSRAVHPFINAIVDERYEAALDDAREVDRFLARNEKSEADIERDTPLLGIPFSCKEAIGIKGLAQTCGLWTERQRKAPSDSVAAGNYRKAGAIPLTVTNVPQLCMWWDSFNHNFGNTLNPYDNSRTCGGSTGGEGAAITSAAALIGIGNDVGGSIRLPSCFNGVYGHKPSFGVVSNNGYFPDLGKIDKYFTTGPLCRYASDLPLLTKVCSGYNPIVQWDAKVDFRKVKIYYMEGIDTFMLAPNLDIKKAIRKAVKHFEDEYEVTATKVNIEELKYAYPIWESKVLELDAPPMMHFLVGSSGKLGLWWELLKCFFGCSRHTFAVIYYAMIERRDKDKAYDKYLKMYNDLKRKLEKMLEGTAVFLFPTQLEPAPHTWLTAPKFPHVGYTGIFSVLHFASTHIPTGLSNGLPIGIQAIGRTKQDHLTLATAAELDKVFKGWNSPCPILD